MPFAKRVQHDNAVVVRAAGKTLSWWAAARYSAAYRERAKAKQNSKHRATVQ